MKDKKILISISILTIILSVSYIFPQVFNQNQFNNPNIYSGQGGYNNPYSTYNQNPGYYSGQGGYNNPYSTYNQNPGYYSGFNNPNNYNRYSGYNPSYYGSYNQFNSPYYPNNINNQNYDPRFNTFPNSQINNQNIYHGNYNNPSRNIQYVDPRFQSQNYGGYNNYNNLGQNSYIQGSGAYGVSGLYGYGNYGGQFGFNQQACQQGQDFLVHIAPGGCSPAVIRSDLLEEQNVPVFCRLAGFQSNPLLSGTRIRSIRMSGQNPQGINGVSYFPGRAAVNRGGFNNGLYGGYGGYGGANRFGGSGIYGNNLNYNQYNTFSPSYPYSSNSQGLITTNPSFGNDYVTSPFNDNMGYIVLVVSRQSGNESALPDFLTGNITATIDYDSAAGYGIGNSVFYLDEMDEATWQREYRENSFWNGRGFLRLEHAENNVATISVYQDVNNRDSTITLREGQISQDLALGGFYCSAGMRIRLERVSSPREAALLQVNGEQIWVADGDRIINNRCRVARVNVAGSGGRLSISCPGNNLEMNLDAGRASFEVDGITKDISINQIAKVEENIYLGYIGKDPTGNNFAVLLRDEISNSELAFTDKEVFLAVERSLAKNNLDPNFFKQDIVNEVMNQYRRKLSNNREVDEKVSVEVIRDNEQAFGIKLVNLFVVQDSTNINQNPLATTYYERAMDYYQDLYELYPNEKIAEGQEPYAAQGLEEAFRLSRDFEQNERASQMTNQLIESYPNSYLAEQAKNNRDQLFRYDRTNANKVIQVDGLQYTINLLEFKKPSLAEASGVFLINGEEVNLGVGEFFNSQNTNIQLLDLETTRANIGYEFTDNNENKISRREILFLGDRSQTNINGINVKLATINLKQQARVSVLPSLQGTRTQAQFSYSIGIEKRLIQLSPEKTKELMENLLEAVNKWDKLNRKLGTVISALKGACFATSALLTVKNLFDGYSGESLSRNRIMKGAGGWNEKCEELVSQGQYRTLHQCLLDKSSEVDGDVKLLADEIERTNNIIKDIQDEIGIERSGILDFKGQIDSKKVEEAFKKRFDSFCQDSDGSVKLPGVDGENVKLSDMCKWDKITHEQRREIMTLYNARQSGGSEVLDKYLDNELGRVSLDAKTLNDAAINQKISQEQAEKFNLRGLKITGPIGDTVTYGNIKILSESDRQGHQVYGNFKAKDNVIMIYVPPSKNIQGANPFQADPQVAGKNVILKVVPNQGSAGIFSPDTSQTAKIYTIEGTELNDKAKASVLDYMSLSKLDKIRQDDNRAFINQMVDQNNLRVKYFERAPFRGLPATIPFDVNEGWYVQMSYVLSGFGTPYDQSGRVTNFYICNIGPNGLIEFKKSSDDICRYYNGFNNNLGFPGMNPSESASLVQRAEAAISQATNQFGKDTVNINGKLFKSGVSFDDTQGQCTDFMSPKDCHLMFNVCDPVICPPSRCDLGGRYRVDNVIQTGIVGSLALCLPNAQEGIAVPICLTGVHAGLDGYISILNSTVQCLNESLETGQNVGICDEIKSIYICDFFWRQAAPFTEILFQNSFESLLGQGVRGGGEYLTVQHAWQNTQGAANFFTQNYALNSIQAFQQRSYQDVQLGGGFAGGGALGGGGVGGGAGFTGSSANFCKAFISSGFSGATSSLFGALIEPDSPVQYHAWFSENILTTATVPPTSHYKVYYHIFAGKDIGSYYSVYLKGVPQTPGIFSTGFQVVDQGYVPRGGQVDRARDLTAVSGFQQLCININGREECGFGQVSTSYLLNSINDAYVEDQVNQKIVSEQNCIAGTPSLYSLAQPNLQAGVQDAINPQLYNSGIIRICASENPGKQVLPSGEFDPTNSVYDRWKDVGYCDDPTIRCWLDSESVKNVVRDTGIESNILNQATLQSLGTNNYYLPDQSETILGQGDELIRDIPSIISTTESESSIQEKIGLVVNNLESLTNLGHNNLFRARAFYQLANIHKKIAKILLNKEIIPDSNLLGITPENIDDPLVIPPSGIPGSDLGEPIIENPALITDDMLIKDVLIILQNPNQPEYRYRFNSELNAWTSQDPTFPLEIDYVAGLGIIAGKLEMNGVISFTFRDDTIVKTIDSPPQEYHEILMSILRIDLQ